MKVCTQAKIITLLVFLCLLSACAKTQLCGSVYTSDKEPAANKKIQVKVEPGNKATWVKRDGSFVLKGLDPNTIYSIIAFCETDNTRARVDNVYIKKGKNELPENQMLILAKRIPTKAWEDTSGAIETSTGPQIPEKP